MLPSLYRIPTQNTMAFQGYFPIPVSCKSFIDLGNPQRAGLSTAGALVGGRGAAFRGPHCHAVAGDLGGGENGIGALGLCRAGVGRLLRVRAHDGASVADTLGAGEERGR